MNEPVSLAPSSHYFSEKDTWLRPGLIAPWWQILLVLAIMVGPFAGRSTWAAWHGSSTHFEEMLVTNDRLLATGAVESLLLAIFLGFLSWRGWTAVDFKIRINGWSSFQAGPLLIVTMLCNSFTVLGLITLVFAIEPTADVVAFLTTIAPHFQPHSIEVSWLVIIGTMVLNAYFEELSCMGYAFNQFAAKRGPLVALMLTVLMRMACHTYQGPLHLLGIGVLFLIYGLWYWRTRNLWTLILAHALLDLGSVGLLKVLYG